MSFRKHRSRSGLLFPLALALISTLVPTIAEEKAPPLEKLYPFLKDRKWGFIRSDGSWAILPQFEKTIGITDTPELLVMEKGKVGWIDRQGHWLIAPEFTNISMGTYPPGVTVAANGKRVGLISTKGKVLLPGKYDEITLAPDRAFVRKGDELGVMNLSGEWIRPIDISWPPSREMPASENPEAFWFRQGKKWGLLSKDGKILFDPKFTAHEMNRHEAEDWSHPAGLDFMDGRAWAIRSGDYWLITDQGKVLGKFAFRDLRHWHGSLFAFTDTNSRKGLIRNDGTVVVPARFDEIMPVSEGMAVVSEKSVIDRPKGEHATNWTYGYISEEGAIVVEPGKFNGPGVRGQLELAPFCEGLAPVWLNAPGDTYNPSAGYIDRQGQIAIPLKYYRTRPFSNGLAEVCLRVEQPNGLSPKPGLWGYVDGSGALVIPAEFGWITPFFRDRAWVMKSGGSWDKPDWAMIDRTGKVLTDFAYFPPEKHSSNPSDDPDLLAKTRWNGNLAVLKQGDFKTGLATADGKVIVEPEFVNIRPFHDGVASAVQMKSSLWFTSLVKEDGRILAPEVYTEVSEFENGAAWVTKRTTDHRGPYQNPAWGLVNTRAEVLLALKYAPAHWIHSPNIPGYTGEPGFYGDLAPVALAEGFQYQGKDLEIIHAWGYVDHHGKIIAWHPAEQKKPGDATEAN